MAFAPTFGTFLVAWAIQGFYVVWLPLEISIIHRRTADTGAQTRLTRRAAGFLVAALEMGVILGAATSGALVTSMQMTLLLTIPAIAVTVCLVVIWFGVAPSPPVHTGRLDLKGFGLVTLAIGLVMAGLILVRIQGPGTPLPWLVLVLGVVAFWPFARFELSLEEPLIDVRLLSTAAQWPVQLTAFLFGMSVLGAQIPLSTFARTDPEVVGYGLGASAGFVTVLIVVYVLSLVAGALLLPIAGRAVGTKRAMLVAALLVAIGYGLFIPFHTTTAQALLNMAIAGLGSGALVAALPAAAAAAAPADRTGFATGMTNTTKTIGGAIASSIFAIALTSAGSIADVKAGHAPLSGYLVVWAICSLTALVAAISLFVVPKDAFAD